MKDTVQKIREAVINGTFHMIKNDKDVTELEGKQPKLYEMITSSQCDNRMLDHMMNLYTKVSTGEITQEKGDEIFGEKAAKKYVYPLVDEK